MDEGTETLLLGCTGFQWNDGNRNKNWVKHRETNSECEEVFFNHPLVIGGAAQHSSREIRFYAWGHTDFSRELFIVFTVRDKKIRIISARDMSKKEREITGDHHDQEDTRIQG